MPFEEHHIEIDYQCRYFTYGVKESAKDIWLVCHGYGQLAKFFLQKFEPLKSGDHYVVAPEGLSRFYLSGFDGRVGATWMTKEDRLTDIENYLHYLSKVYRMELEDLVSRRGAKVNLLGFSQGVATICRWATFENYPFDRLILWAGIIPPDLDFDLGKKALRGKSCHIVYGESDPYIKKEYLDKQNSAMDRLGIQAQTTTFSGGHDIEAQPLKELVKSFYSPL